MRRFEFPMRQYLTFVGFDQEYSLLALADAVELRPLFEVNCGEIQPVIECRRAWDKSPPYCAIVPGGSEQRLPNDNQLLLKK